MSHRFRTAAACRIAEIDRNRFNEAVAAGNYKCAPTTTPGSSRIFEEVDLIVLFVYGANLREGYEPKMAGEFAHVVYEGLKQKPTAKVVSRLLGLNGLKRTVADARPAVLSPNNPVIQRNDFEITPIRKFIRAAMKEEAAILGEDD